MNDLTLAPTSPSAWRDTATALTIFGARALIDDRLEETVVSIEGGRIVEIAGSERHATGPRLDGRGFLLLPGIVDLHGDAFERSLMPRPGVLFPPELAFDEADRMMAGFGITTALHGLTCSWELGLRSHETFVTLARNLRALRGRLRCDTHVHLRFEVTHHDGVAHVLPLIADGTVGALAFNDHLADTENDLGNPEKAARYAGRAGMSVEALRSLLRDVRARDGEVEATMRTLALAAGAAGVAMMSHDDRDTATRARYRALGADIAEFPLTRAVAADARAHGEHVVMGSPNILRGGSHKPGNPSAADLAGEGLCTVLTSDYYYPSPLHAAFRLAADGIMPLTRAWDLVSANPAAALGFDDRGRIAIGRRADLLLVEPGAGRGQGPSVAATLVAGRRAFSTIAG